MKSTIFKIGQKWENIQSGRLQNGDKGHRQLFLSQKRLQEDIAYVHLPPTIRGIP